jgi:Fe-S oxidoreductase
MEKALGLSAKRSLPHYTVERFDKWFSKRAASGAIDSRNKRGKVILWDDTFVRYHEPEIGQAAVKVLEALGFEVTLPQNRKCCGRPAFSQGNLDLAGELGRHNIDLLSSDSNAPIVFLEASCYSMFVEDYRELKIDGIEKVSARCYLFEQFVDNILEKEPAALRFQERSANVAIHAHCHAKSLINPAFMAKLIERLPGRKATLLNTGCCGMAGAFGALASKYDLSVQVAGPLVQQIAEQPNGSEIVASGTSCRHQIVDLTTARPQHMAQVIADAMT